MATDQVAFAIRSVETAILAACSYVRLIYVEPDFVEVDSAALAVTGAMRRTTSTTDARPLPPRAPVS